MNPTPSASEPVDFVLADLLEELTTLLGRGDLAGVEAFLASHPSQESSLRQRLPLIRALAALGEASVDLSPADETPGRLGDFQILQEAGRGGMGVVYEAEQISLGRRVALKVLPFAAAMDARHLQRFKNESRAAAQLHHPHIVPVFGVGEQRGVHYYAMQFIDGQSLAALIADLRRAAPGSRSAAAGQPAATTQHSARGPEYLRSVARLGLHAAEALEHAHQVGILHRDIKPANLMLDADGKVWVTDFGLAQFRGHPDLTATGDLLGTIRYMSPEQALARRDLVDHRSDVYSLGVTLYEALTLEPAFPGVDREELLQQIARGNPRGPRQVNPAVPIDLETVVLKAMASDPSRRYATAQDLADDLRRFLTDQPLVARRPALRERAADWARRHSGFVSAAAIIAGVACVCLLVSFLFVWRAQGREQAAADQARRSRDRAEAHFVKALDGVNRLLLQLDDPRWEESAQTRQLRAELIAQALQFYEEFVQEDATDPVVRFEAARACRRMAGVCCATQDVAGAQAWMGKGIALLEGLSAEQPDAPVYRNELAATLSLQGYLHYSLRHPAEARAAFAAAAEQFRQALLHDAGSEARNRYAELLADCPCVEIRDSGTAVAQAQIAVNLDPGVGRYWSTLGVALYRAGEDAAAVEALRKSVQLGGGPGDWYILAMAHWKRGDHDAAQTWHAKAADWMHQHPRPSEELLRYQVEAQALFGQGAAEANGRSPK
jgi:eukaryotic-like serine/threonine-protein kinase